LQLDKKAMSDSVESKLSNFSKEVSACNEQVLGSLLFTCAGRIPESKLQLYGEHLSRAPPLPPRVDELDDVKSFEKHFPTATISGFYANGEIGPIKPELSEGEGNNGSETSLLKTVNFKSEVQGFTAVFGMFLKPTKLQKSVHFLNIDASSSQVLSNYIKTKLG
jgi:hypothetical protein